MGLTAKTAGRQEFIPLITALVRAYQSFSQYDSTGIKSLGLTVPQADVIFTLGNTEGMSFKEIGEATLITKGTLTGVIQRLEEKGLVSCRPHEDDGRSIRVQLSNKGTSLFETAFPKHIAYLKLRFDRLNTKEREEILLSLKKLHNIFC